MLNRRKGSLVISRYFLSITLLFLSLAPARADSNMDDSLKKTDEIKETTNKQSSEEALIKINNAIKKCNEILEREPDNISAYKTLAGAYLYKEMYSSAIKIFEKCIELGPSDFTAYYGMGFCYHRQAESFIFGEHPNYQKGREAYEQANQMYKKALKISPGLKAAEQGLKDIADDLEFMSNKETITKDLDEWKVEQGQSEQIDKYWNLAAVASNNKDYRQAIKYLEKIEKIEPNYHESIYYNIALEYKNWGKYEKAIKFYKKQILLNPQEKSPRLYSHLGLMESYYKLSEFDKAKQEGNNALKLDPENKRAKRYLEKIKKSEKQK